VVKQKTKVTISFTLSVDLAKELDKCAESMGMNRSAFLEWLLSKALPIVPAMANVLETIFKSQLEAQKKPQK